MQVNTAIDNPYNLFDLKPDNASQGPTPLVNSLVISFQDLPPRVAQFLYVALKQEIAETPGIYQVKGDANGIIPILDIIVTNDPPVAGQAATATVELVFREPGLDGIFNTPDDVGKPLPDDRFTLTILDEIQDLAGNHLDGESNASEPHNTPHFPSGDGVPGGDFIARFTVDSRPEIGTWSAGSVYADINGNFIFDPENLDYTNRDLEFSFGYTSDNLFAGDFTPIGAESANGFDKLGAYGKVGGQYRWSVDTTDDGVPDLVVNDPANFNGSPVAGNFDPNTPGDEVGLYNGTTWFLDTNHDYNVDTQITTALRGYPIVGDFDGDGVFDLATYQVNPVNKFFFDLGGNGYGSVDATIDAASQFGFIGVRARPVAADMDQDGATDVGIWVPDRSGATGNNIGEYYFLLSDSQTTVGTVNALDHQFSPTPLGHDIFARFGNHYAMPIVGNFDPPATPAAANSGPAIMGVVTSVSGANPVVTWTLDDKDGIASTTFTVDGKKVQVYGPYGTKMHASYSVSLAGLNLSPGNHSFVIQAADSARNSVTTKYAGTFNVVGVTNTGPAISGVVAAVSGSNPVVTWTLDDSNGIASTTITVDGRKVQVYGPYGSKTHANYAAALAGLKLSPGDHSFVIQATDSAAKPVTTKYNGTFTVVGTTNGGTTNSGPTIRNVVASTAKSVITWNASDPDGVASIRLMIDGAAVSGVGGPYKAASGANYSWSFGSLSVGTHKYVIRATDRTGKVSTSSGSFAVSAPSLAARNAVFAGASLSGVSNSAKVDWLYDLGGLLDSTESQKKNTSVGP